MPNQPLTEMNFDNKKRSLVGINQYYLKYLNLRYKIIERGARAFAASDFRNWYSAATAEKTSVAAIEFKSLTLAMFSAYYLIPFKIL